MSIYNSKLPSLKDKIQAQALEKARIEAEAKLVAEEAMEVEKSGIRKLKVGKSKKWITKWIKIY